MKKFLLIGLIVGLALVLVGGVGVVYARVQQANNPATVTVTTGQQRNQQVPFGIMRNGRQVDPGIFVGPGGMMGEFNYRTGPNGKSQGNGYGYGPGGMMGGYGRGGMMDGYGRGGMMGGLRGEGVMHDYMISAFASAVGLTVDEVNTRLTNGETPREIALAQGKTAADLPALWQQVRQDALKATVAAGVITQAQADVMLEHMNNFSGNDFGPGNGFGDCPMWDDDEAQP
ncbi:MAG: hypothetical protein C3F13_08610 [Anaerolineales bacterium]|nr:hypothetical protein [Anaerolineae bacterium]PWB53469.1 MAG: hypothetical protein C3F13_08610 [Anaerolineales bacterium]